MESEPLNLMKWLDEVERLCLDRHDLDPEDFEGVVEDWNKDDPTNTKDDFQSDLETAWKQKMTPLEATKFMVAQGSLPEPHLNNGDRVKLKASGKEGWIKSWYTADNGKPLVTVVWDDPAENGVDGYMIHWANEVEEI